MRNLEKQVDALMRLALSETDEEQDEALATIRRLLVGPEARPRDAESHIRNVLADVGIPENILGHRYLVTALTLAVKDPAVVDTMTKGLYPAVAAQHHTTGSRAERAICHAIENAWDRGDMDVLYHYFGNTISMVKGKPTNSEFIARIANVVRAQL